MRKVFFGAVSLAILVAVIQTWAQAPEEQATPIPEAAQKHILETFGRNLKELEENPDVLGIVPSPGTGEIWIISDRPGNVPKVVEDVPVKILPPPPHLPPPPGVIVLRPGGGIERREDLNSCPEEFKEETKYRWRFCQPIEGNPEPLPGHLLNPPVAGVPYEKAEEIFKRNEERLMQIPGTNGVGLGLDGITVYTDHPELVPNDIEGIPVKAVPRQEFRRTSHTTTQTTTPFHGGTATGVRLPGWGTSTGIVLADGKPWLLFTAHSLEGCENDPTPPAEIRALPGVVSVNFSADGLVVETVKPEILPTNVEGLPVIPIPPIDADGVGVLERGLPPRASAPLPPDFPPVADEPPHPVACPPGATLEPGAHRCKYTKPNQVPTTTLIPPPPGVIVLRPGKVRERRDSCPEKFEEINAYGWRFCLDPQNPQEIPPLYGPPIAGIPYEEALAINNRHVDEIMKIPGVVAAGLGMDGIHVETSNPDLVPKQIEGLPVIVKPPVRRGPAGHTFNNPVRPLHGAAALYSYTVNNGGTLGSRTVSTRL